MILAHLGGESPQQHGALGPCERNRNPFVHRGEAQAALALANANPTAWPSPSQEAAAGKHPSGMEPREDPRERLASEVEVVWLDPAARELPWLREWFWDFRLEEDPALKAYTLDGSGQVVRSFLIGDRSLAAYAELQRKGCGTCPIEAVDPRTIRPAVPALPAHPGLLALLREAGR